MNIHISSELLIKARAGEAVSTPELHKLGERVMEALLDLEKCNEGLWDSTTATDGTDGSILVEFVLAGYELHDVMPEALAILRSALLAAEIGTPVWPGMPAEAEETGTPVEFAGVHMAPAA